MRRTARLKRGDIVAYLTPPKAVQRCGEIGKFVHRIIGLPGHTVHEDPRGFVHVDGKRLSEPYVANAARRTDSIHFNETWHVPKDAYFVMGDSRSAACDSRVWGGLPRHDVLGKVVKIFRPPHTVIIPASALGPGNV